MSRSLSGLRLFLILYSVYKSVTKTAVLHKKTAMTLSSLPLFLYVPCENRTHNYSLGGYRYIHLTKGTKIQPLDYIFFIRFMQ